MEVTLLFLFLLHSAWHPKLSKEEFRNGYKFRVGYMGRYRLLSQVNMLI